MFSGVVDGKSYRNLLNGEWVSSKNEIEIKSPVNGELLGKTPAMSQDDIDKAISGTKEAFKSWRYSSLRDRADILYNTAKILLENVNDMGTLLSKEISKNISGAKTEIKRTAEFLKFTAEEGLRIREEVMRGDSFSKDNKNKISMVIREPIGTILAISPFNYPINLAASKIAPALMAGDVVLFKPPTQGSLSGLLLVKAFELGGVPKGVINSITGRGREIGDYTTSHEGIDLINFTGSVNVGEQIARVAKTKDVIMELGGKDPAIILDDVDDIEKIANECVKGAFSYAGQRCTAIKRVLVMESIADNFVAALKKYTEMLTVGNPQDDCTVTPLIDKQSADFVQSLIDDAKLKGAKVLVGDKREENLIYPTLVDDVTLDMNLAWEEPFGPVLPIIRVKDPEEALEIANRSEYGLQASVYTNNLQKAMYLSKKLEAGVVQINGAPSRGPDHFPFTGIKESGRGATQGIRFSIESMTRLKGIVLNI